MWIDKYLVQPSVLFPVTAPLSSWSCRRPKRLLLSVAAWWLRGIAPVVDLATDVLAAPPHPNVAAIHDLCPMWRDWRLLPPNWTDPIPIFRICGVAVWHGQVAFVLSVSERRRNSRGDIMLMCAFLISRNLGIFHGPLL